MSSKRILSIGSKHDYRLEPAYIEAKRRREENEKVTLSRKRARGSINDIEIYTGIEGMKAFDRIMKSSLENFILFLYQLPFL